MNAADAPRKIIIPWSAQAGSAYTRSVPDAGTTADTSASWAQGFPPNTFTPVGSGGTPVNGADMNGGLLELSAIARWAQDGGTFAFDSAYATAIGGYRKGAILQSSTTTGLLWQSTADANTVNPDSGPSANWVALGTTKLSLGVIGYRVGADGFIEQWGGISLPAGGQATVTFPLSFPNACLNVQATNTSGGGAPSAWPGTGSYTTTNFVLSSAASSGVAPTMAGVTHAWRAIGY